MPRADRTYQQTSRGSRVLVTILAIGVSLLAVWIFIANTILSPALNPAVSNDTVAAEQTPAVEEPAALPAPVQTAAAEVPIPPAATETTAAATTEEVAVTAVVDPAPALEEPVVIASAQGLPRPAQPAPAVLAPARSMAVDPEPSEPTVGALPDIVPLPPRRPKAAAIPRPRPRPELEVATDHVSDQVLSEVAIDRMW